MSRNRNRDRNQQGRNMNQDQTNQSSEETKPLIHGEDVSLNPNVELPPVSGDETPVIGVSDHLLSEEEVTQPGSEEAPVAQAEEALAAEPAKEAAPPAAPEPPVVQESIKPVVKAAAPKPQPDQDVKEVEIDQYLYKAEHEGTPEQKRIIQALKVFSEKMIPRTSLDPAVAFSAQWELLGHLRSLLEKDYEDFRKGWNALLIYFHRHRGVDSSSEYSPLSRINTDRYLDYWKRDDSTRELYTRLLTLVRMTANPETRQKDIRNIVIERVGEGILSDRALTNLKSFYQS